MSVQSEINRLKNAKTKLRNWLTTNGFSVASNAKLDAICSQIEGITINSYYTGTGAPDDLLGEKGDVYFQIGG